KRCDRAECLLNRSKSPTILSGRVCCMTQMEDVVRQSIATVCDIDAAQVGADSKLSDLGVDSLAAAERLGDVEIRIGQDRPDSVLRELDGAETVGLIAARLDALLGTVEQG